MRDFIATYPSVSWIIAVLLIGGSLLWAMRSGLGLLMRRLQSRGRGGYHTLGILRRVLTAFMLLVGALLIAYGLIDKEHYATLTTNLQRLLWIATVVMLTIVSSAVTQHFLSQRIEGATKSEESDATTLRFLSYLANFVIYGLGLSLAAAAVPALRTLAQTALAGAGVLALVVGVASQEGIANIVSGMLIVAFRPFRVGDVIKLDSGLMGRVEDITLRHTVIANFENQRVLVSNANINKADVVNYHLTDKRACEFIEVGIGYYADLEYVMKIFAEICEDHPYCISPGSDRKVVVRVMDLEDSAIKLRAWVWARNFQLGFVMKRDILREVKLRFDAEGITIPFPQRTLSLDADTKDLIMSLVSPERRTLDAELPEPKIEASVEA